jgi:hypothetical protein
MNESRHSVEIRRYVRKKKAETPLQYKYSLWGEFQTQFSTRSVIFKHVELQSYNWSNLDNMICTDKGDNSNIDGLKFWRVRLLLIPQDSLPRGNLVIFFFSNFF